MCAFNKVQEPREPETFPPPGTVQVGVVTGIHGTNGDIRVSSDSDNPDRFKQGSFVSINGHSYKIARSASTARVLLIHLEGIESEADAGGLIHHRIVVTESDVPSTPNGTYYHFQLIGLNVNEESGTALGTLVEVLATGANDVYIVRDGTSEILIPAITEVIKSISMNEKVMIVSLPLGLESRNVSAARAKTPRRYRPRKSPKSGRPKINN